MGRCQSSLMTDPTQTMELLRTILQPDINMKIQVLLNQYLESHFKPAFSNMKENLGKNFTYSISTKTVHILRNPVGGGGPGSLFAKLSSSWQVQCQFNCELRLVL